MVKPAAILIMVLSLVVGCSQKVANYDYNTTVNFHELQTYTVKANDKTSFQSLDSARIEQAITTTFANRYQKLEDEPADFSVRYHFEAQRKIDRSGVSFGFGVGTGNVGVGVSTGSSAKERVEQHLVLSVISGETRQVIWQAKAAKGMALELEAAEREAIIQSTVKTMLSNFPP